MHSIAAAALLTGSLLLVCVPAAAQPTEPGRPRFSESVAFQTLYVSFGLLQLLDAQSTSRALASGAREANPLFGGIAHHPVRLMGAKTAVAAGTVLLVERVRKRHPRLAIATMIALNSAYEVVTVRNSRVAHQLRVR